MKFFISKNKKLPAAAQKGLQPGKEFMTQGRERFLAAFDASELSRNAHGLRGATRPAYVTAFFKIGVGVLAVLCVGIGLSAYADTANVGATNPLYPLKRLGENVQLALAPASEKPQLQATFAVRRANEIAALQVSAPSSTLIPALTSALDQDIDTSLSELAANNANGPQATSTNSSTITAAAEISASSSAAIGPIDVYCNAFSVSTSGVLIGHLEAGLALRANGFADFNEQCGGTHTLAPTPSEDQGHHHHPPVDGQAMMEASGTMPGATTTAPISNSGTRMGAGAGSFSGDGTSTSGAAITSTVGIHIDTPKIGL